MALLNLGYLGTLLLVDKKTQTWLGLAKSDLEFAEGILQNKQRPAYAVFFCHQALEKILKAVVQHTTGNIPPRTHNLENLLQLVQKELPQEKLDILIQLAPHYLGTRYPDDLAKFSKKYSDEFVRPLFQKTKELFLWIENTWLI